MIDKIRSLKSEAENLLGEIKSRPHPRVVSGFWDISKLTLLGTTLVVLIGSYNG